MLLDPQDGGTRQADDGIAPPFLTAVYGLEQVGIAATGQLDIRTERGVEIGEDLACQGDSIVILADQVTKYFRCHSQLSHKLPPPQGEGWGEGIKYKQLLDNKSPLPDPLPKGKGTLIKSCRKIAGHITPSPACAVCNRDCLFSELHMVRPPSRAAGISRPANRSLHPAPLRVYQPRDCIRSSCRRSGNRPRVPRQHR